MALDFDFNDILETIELNKDELLGDRILVNELLIDDFMQLLGYNKKKDRTVRRITSESFPDIDWLVGTDDDVRLAVKTYPLGTDIKSEDTTSLKLACSEDNCNILVCTNGQAYSIFRLKDGEDAVTLAEFDIADESTLEDSVNGVLGAISKDGYDLEMLDMIYASVKVTSELVEEKLIENKDAISEIIANSIKESDTKVLEDTKEVVTQVFNRFTLKNTDSLGKNTEDIDEKVAHLNIRIGELEEVIHEKDKIINEVTLDNASLKSELSEKDDQLGILEAQLESVDLESEESGVDADNTKLKDDLEAVNKELETVKSELEAAKDEVEAAKNEVEAKEAEIQSNESKIADLEDDVNNKVEKITNLENDLKAKVDEINELTEKLDNMPIDMDGSDDSIKDDEIKELRDKLEEKDSHLIDANHTITTLKEQIEELKTNGSKSDTELVNNYIRQIQDLSNSLGIEKELTETLKGDIKELEEKLSGLTGVEEQKAEELLAVIEDDPNSSRQYVGVVNKELMQCGELHKFVGQILHRLYEIGGLAVSQKLFDGDLFKLDSNSVRHDVVFDNRSYDIDFLGADETEVLNKLRILFSNFDGIIFKCKKIGKLDDNNVAVESNASADEFNIGSESNAFDNNDDTFDELPDENENANFEESEVAQNSKDKLIVVQLVAVDEVLYTDEPVEFKTIVYAGNNSMTFNINKERKNLPLEALINKTIEAGLAIAESEGQSNAVQLLKQLDLTTVNDKFHLYTEEYKDKQRISGTNYAITDVTDIKNATQIIVDVFNALDIMSDDKFLYYIVESDSEMIDAYSFDEEAVQMRNDPFFEASETDERATAIIRADMLNKITMTVKSLKTHVDIFDRVLGVKTRYLEKKIQSDDDVAEVVSSMLMEAAKQNITVVYPAFGNVVGSSNVKLMSDKASDVGENPIELNILDTVVYMARLKPWQVPSSLIKLQNEIFKDSSMAMQCIINYTALNYYRDEFNTSETALSLAVKSFAQFISESKVKPLNK